MRNIGLLLLMVCLFAGCGEKLKVEQQLDPEVEKAKWSFAAEVSKPKTEKEKIQEAAAAKAEAEKAQLESQVSKNESVPDSEQAPKSKSVPAESTTDNSPQVAKVDARTVLSKAVATAKNDGKAVFVHFTADW